MTSRRIRYVLTIPVWFFLAAGLLFPAPAAADLEECLAFLVPAAGGVTITDIQAVLLKSDDADRRDKLKDEAAFTDLVKQEASRKAILRSMKAGLAKGEIDRGKLQRQLEDQLISYYLKSEILRNLEPGFPADALVRQYYEMNREQFRLGERTNIQQIFLHVPEGAPDDEVARIEKKAGELVNLLNSGKVQFADLAKEYSQHKASSLVGGYMGVELLDNLVPEIRDAVQSLNIDQVSKPIRTTGGFHIVKRGEILPARGIPFESVAASIREGLLKSRAQEITQQRLAEIQKKYSALPTAQEISGMYKTLTK